MNDFKYQKKTKNSEEVMNSFKDFNQVLDKHKAISTSYKAVWKWAIAATSAVAVIVGLFMFNDNSESNNLTPVAVIKLEEKTETIPVSVTQTKPVIVLAKNESPIESKVKVIKEVEPKKQIKITKPKRSVKKQQNIAITKKESKIEIDTAKIIKEREDKLETWFSVNEKTPEERITLPNLYVSNFRWPNAIDKTQLVKSPTINAMYSGVARQIPIVGGKVYITELNSKVKPKGYSLKEGNFPPELIREIHRSGDNAILLFKDVKLLIPGRGPISVGDLQVKIQLDKNYKKKLK